MSKKKGIKRKSPMIEGIKYGFLGMVLAGIGVGFINPEWIGTGINFGLLGGVIIGVLSAIKSNKLLKSAGKVRDAMPGTPAVSEPAEPLASSDSEMEGEAKVGSHTDIGTESSIVTGDNVTVQFKIEINLFLHTNVDSYKQDEEFSAIVPSALIKRAYTEDDSVALVENIFGNQDLVNELAHYYRKALDHPMETGFSIWWLKTPYGEVRSHELDNKKGFEALAEILSLGYIRFEQNYEPFFEPQY